MPAEPHGLARVLAADGDRPGDVVRPVEHHGVRALHGAGVTDRSPAVQDETHPIPTVRRERIGRTGRHRCDRLGVEGLPARGRCVERVDDPHEVGWRRHPCSGGAEGLHVVAVRRRTVLDLTGAGVVGRGEPHAGDPERREQPFVDDLLVRLAGEVLDEEAEDAVVHVAVPEATSTDRTGEPDGGGLATRADLIAEEHVLVLREPGGVRQQLPDRDVARVRRRDAEIVGNQPTDRVVEPDESFLDELQHGDRRDHLGDAGDPEPIRGRDRRCGLRHPHAHRGLVDDVTVDGDRDRHGVGSSTQHGPADLGIERRPAGQRFGGRAGRPRQRCDRDPIDVVARKRAAGPAPRCRPTRSTVGR